MGKLGTDSYLDRFAKYGDGKCKKKKKDGAKKKDHDSGKKKDSGKKPEKSSKKLYKQLEARVESLEERVKKSDAAASETLSFIHTKNDAVSQFIEETNSRLSRLEKNQKTMASQVKTLGKAQKTMQEDINAVVDDISEAEAPSED